MDIQVIFQGVRNIVFELQNEGVYETAEYEVFLNDELVQKSSKIIESIYGLKPDTSYSLYLKRGEERSGEIVFTTVKESFTLNVKDFGAKGDGIKDDTRFIQAAICSCPEGGRVFVPKGTYKITSIFLKSNLILEIGKGAVLSAFTDRGLFPVLPGLIESYDESQEYNLGSWEGNPLDSFASILTGIQVENVIICGEGAIDGCAGFENWWKNPKDKNIAFRPRMIFLNHCRNITVTGITVQNSPAWNIHPYFSKDLRFIDIKVLGPANSHNTDGLDPESCENVEIAGCYFSVGDDCIAVKSGKIYMGRKFKVPSKGIHIRQSLMQDGHGAITLGSEIAAGVYDFSVTDCIFRDTDRGLRVKTRRGRGKDSVLDNILFQNIKMDHVKAPFVVNSFYFCDPDGKSQYVSSKEKLPVDDRTPSIKSLIFKNIQCENSHFTGAYIYGLPENKIESLVMENVSISYAEDAVTGVAAMMIGCEPTSKQGIYLNNIKKVVLKNVTVTGCVGETIECEEVDELKRL
jgi:polygalacturonase